MEPTIIGEIPRNAKEVTRVSISEFKGKKYVDIRVWFKSENGDYAPGKKGIAIATENLEQLKKLIQKSEDYLGNTDVSGAR